MSELKACEVQLGDKLLAKQLETIFMAERDVDNLKSAEEFIARYRVVASRPAPERSTLRNEPDCLSKGWIEGGLPREFLSALQSRPCMLLSVNRVVSYHDESSPYYKSAISTVSDDIQALPLILHAIEKGDGVELELCQGILKVTATPKDAATERHNELREVAKKTAEWLRRLERQAKAQEKQNRGHFDSLADSCKADAANYAKVAGDIEAALAEQAAPVKEGEGLELSAFRLKERLEAWHKLPEPRCRKVDGEGPNAAKHNAKVAADLEDGKTYLMYDHHRGAFWGPNMGGYQYRKGAGFYDKAGALRVMANSDRYFTAEEVPADILVAVETLASLAAPVATEKGNG